MAHTKFSYVKKFEIDDTLLPNCWIVARVDGRGFHKFAKSHNWSRPNDLQAIQLMNKAAHLVMEEFNECILAYGQSDEFSFVFHPSTEIFQRRSSKIITTLVSKFTSAYVYHWTNFFRDKPLLYPPSFDGRIVLYPSNENIRDYLSWRQADCHINNLYNTTFWALVQQGKLSHSAAEKRLSGTLSGDKNEILFSEFGINYNNEPEIFRKGTVLVREQYYKDMKQSRVNSNDNSCSNDYTDDKGKASTAHCVVEELNCDIIGDIFWDKYSYILAKKVKK